MLNPKHLANCEIRVSSINRVGTVLIAPRPLEAVTENIIRPGFISVVLTFGAGVDWPDRQGLGLMAAALGEGEVVALEFARLADALRCEAELHRLMAVAK